MSDAHATVSFYQVAEKFGIAWAEEKATRVQFQAIEARRKSRTLAKVTLEEMECAIDPSCVQWHVERDVADQKRLQFWRETTGCAIELRTVEDPTFVSSFIDGVLQVWDALKKT
jgi:hypothetical protein